MAADERAVHATGHGCRVFRKQFRMRRVGSVIKGDTVFAIRRTLARDHENLPVGRRHDVVNQPRVDFHGVGEFRMRRIRDVVNKKAIGDRRVVSVVADDPFFGALELFEWRAADDFDFAFEVAWRNHDRSAGRKIPARSRHDVGARLLGNESAIGIDAGAVPSHRPARREIICRISFRRKVNDIAGARIAAEDACRRLQLYCAADDKRSRDRLNLDRFDRRGLYFDSREAGWTRFTRWAIKYRSGDYFARSEESYVATIVGSRGVEWSGEISCWLFVKTAGRQRSSRAAAL